VPIPGTTRVHRQRREGFDQQKRLGQAMELNGALSNPFANDKESRLAGLATLHGRLLQQAATSPRPTAPGGTESESSA
jgi:hypothetical protein